MTFDAWLYYVDLLFFENIGCGHDDVEDWLWHDAYVDGQSPTQAFESWYEATEYENRWNEENA